MLSAVDHTYAVSTQILSVIYHTCTVCTQVMSVIDPHKNCQYKGPVICHTGIIIAHVPSIIDHTDTDIVNAQVL